MGGFWGTADSFIHGLLWFITGFALASLLSFWHQQQVQSYVVQRDSVSKFGFSQVSKSMGPTTTRVFLLETEGDRGSSLVDKFSDDGVDSLLRRNSSNWKKDEKSGGVPVNPTKFSPRVTQEDLTVLQIDLKDEQDSDTKEDLNYKKLKEGLVQPWEKKDREECFLFIGILSGSGMRERRDAVREAWADVGNRIDSVVIRFILTMGENDTLTNYEALMKKDMLFIMQPGNDYRSILHKVYGIYEYVAENYDARFVLKTDDDAFVNVPALVNWLYQQCENPGCKKERLYIGFEKTDSPVLRASSWTEHPEWINQEYFDVIKHDIYIPYMMGGGYILSGDLVEMLIQMQRSVGLFWSPIEDVTVGLWMIGLDIRRISDQMAFMTEGYECCFHDFPDRAGDALIGHSRLIVDVCLEDYPRLILHSVKNTTQMKLLGWRIKNCEITLQSQLPHLVN